MIDQRYMVLFLMFMCACCGLFIGYVFGKWRERVAWEDRVYGNGWPEPEDNWPEPEGDFDGGYVHDYQPRRLTSLTSRTTEN